jgi:type IV secretory pathway VirB3-like protein
MVTAAVPVLENPKYVAAVVVPMFWVPKLALAGETDMISVALCAVPKIGTAWGLPAAVSVKSRFVWRIPAARGVKLTETVDTLLVP